MSFLTKVVFEEIAEKINLYSNVHFRFDSTFRNICSEDYSQAVFIPHVDQIRRRIFFKDLDERQDELNYKVLSGCIIFYTSTDKIFKMANYNFYGLHGLYASCLQTRPIYRWYENNRLKYTLRIKDGLVIYFKTKGIRYSWTQTDDCVYLESKNSIYLHTICSMQLTIYTCPQSFPLELFQSLFPILPKDIARHIISFIKKQYIW